MAMHRRPLCALVYRTALRSTRGRDSRRRQSGWARGQRGPAARSPQPATRLPARPSISQCIIVLPRCHAATPTAPTTIFRPFIRRRRRRCLPSLISQPPTARLPDQRSPAQPSASSKRIRVPAPRLSLSPGSAIRCDAASACDRGFRRVKTAPVAK
ncbi:hypothetical protein BS50DRAFT_179526 [Corynespora cassiicola Philippines]|uniref:Uncharacterized protein n=1 Tax=Corynespora cassiicola Philippines TaxID=1448308 RepID=A0A2T2P5Z9_CORCC|nr:hypothetical protein BS50DRAFT_179526 [Corynespora cassiicola Philippines]